MPLDTSASFLARRGKACVWDAAPGSHYNLQSCEVAPAQQVAFQRPVEAALPGTAHPVCLLWGMKSSGNVKGNFRYSWNQMRSSGEKFRGISFAGRGREQEVGSIWADSTMPTEKVKNNQHGSRWNSVIPVVPVGVRHLNAFANSVRDLELK